MENIIDFNSVNIDLDKNELVIIDQTKLPNETKILRLSKIKDIWDAIYLLKVRGAPAIGIAGAIGIYIASTKNETESFDEFYKKFKEQKEYLDSSRPTAVNLSWALNRMEKVVLDNKNKTIKEIVVLLKNECLEIIEEDTWVCKTIGEYGLSLIKDGDGILTHCNPGALATSKYGTATAPMYLGHEKGYKFKVFADETRPLLQGARLTAYELHESGIDVTLICDNMASIVMSKGWVQAVFVGCDRVAKNGDTANKIGTSGVAILAKHYGIPVYVCAPTPTIDLNCDTGDDIHIEERPAEEITEMWYKERMAPKGVKTYNPAFDVTSNECITAIITEYGIAKAPYEKSLVEIFEKKKASQK